MRLQRAGPALVVGLLFLAGPSCTSNSAHPSQSAETPATEELAWTRYSELQARIPALSPPSVVRHADGSLGYLHGIIVRQGQLSQRPAILPNGQTVTLEEAAADFYLEHSRRWGRIVIESARDLLAHDTEDQHFAVWLDRSTATPEATLARAKELDPNAKLLGAPDVLLMTASTKQMIDFSRGAGIFKAILDAPIAQRKAGVNYDSTVLPSLPYTQWAPSSAVTTNSDTNFNANGVYGTGIKVGIQGLSNGCRVDGTHEAFDNLSGGRFTYEAPPSNCADCNMECDTTTNPYDLLKNAADCVSGECRDRHTTAVASRIASSQSNAVVSGEPTGAFHAAEVEFFLGSFPGGIATSLLDILQSYNWLDSHGVKIVNESIGAQADDPGTGQLGFSEWSVASDWFARNKGMTIVRSTGNRFGYKSNPSSGNEVSCAGLNSICVGSAGWISKFNTDPRNIGEYYWAGTSRWANPYSYLGSEIKEIEKPDLLAEGDGTTVQAALSQAISGNTYTWYPVPQPGNSPLRADGSSFAAPVVTGLTALLADQCGMPVSGSAYFRVVFRTLGTWIPSQAETLPPTGFSVPQCTRLPAGSPPPLYPAPQFGCDFYGGTGVVSAKFLDGRACPGGSSIECGTKDNPCAGSGQGTLTQENISSQPPWIVTNSTDWYDNSKKALRQAGQGYAPLVSFGATGAGTRIRFTFSYYSCPAASNASPNALSTANNLDVVLSGRRSGSTNEEIIFASESLDDTNEGFDVELPADFQTVNIGLITPHNLNSCPDAAGNPVIGEPYAWMWAIGG